MRANVPEIREALAPFLTSSETSPSGLPLRSPVPSHVPLAQSPRRSCRSCSPSARRSPSTSKMAERPPAATCSKRGSIGAARSRSRPRARGDGRGRPSRAEAEANGRGLTGARRVPRFRVQSAGRASRREPQRIGIDRAHNDGRYTRENAVLRFAKSHEGHPAELRAFVERRISAWLGALARTRSARGDNVPATTRA